MFENSDPRHRLEPPKLVAGIYGPINDISLTWRNIVALSSDPITASQDITLVDKIKSMKKNELNNIAKQLDIRDYRKYTNELLAERIIFISRYIPIPDPALSDIMPVLG